MNKDVTEIKAFLEAEGSLLVVTHIFPDGDAIGSLLAFDGMLNQMGVEHSIAVDDNCPDKYSFLPGYNRIQCLHTDPIVEKVDRMVILDAGALPRIGSAQQTIGDNTRILNIDHHFTGDEYGEINHVDVTACATTEILYRLCKELKCDIDLQIASGVYVGILTDTGRFRFNNTSEAALRICGEMVTVGVDPGWVTENVYFNMHFEQVQALARALLTIELHFGGLACMLQLDQSHFAIDTEGFVDYASSIKGVALAAFISEMDTQVYKVSLRSRCMIDVSQVASKFGGGGHIKAAGFRYRGSKVVLVESILTEFKNQIELHELRPGQNYLDLNGREGEEIAEWSAEWTEN